MKLPVTDGKPWYFISPHLDDAVFSAGALMGNLQNKAHVSVVNVFTKCGEVNTLSARAYLNQCHVQDASKLYRERRREDKKAIESLGAKVIDLKHVEALWRVKNGKVHTTGIFRKLPELSAVYPTYRLHIARGKVSRYDRDLITTIAAELTSIITDPSAHIVCPVGYGNHVDHQIVRLACEQAFGRDKIIYWLDFPYSIRVRPPQSFAKDNNLSSVEYHHTGTRKLRACQIYTSQFAQVIGDNTSVKTPETFFTHNSHSPSLLWRERVALHLKAFYKAPKDYIYDMVCEKPHTKKFVPYSQAQQKAADTLKNTILRHIPSAHPQVIGSTGLQAPGAGDIDMLIPVGNSNFPEYEKILTKLFGPLSHRTHTMMQWKCEIAGRSCDIDVIDPTSRRYKQQIGLYNKLRSNNIFLSKYRKFKESCNGMSSRDYSVAKINFFKDIHFNVLNDGVWPQEINGYSFAREITDANNFSSYTFAEYRNSRGMQAIAKRWVGRRYTLSYKWLKNERNVYAALESAKGYNNKSSEIRQPSLLGVYEDSSTLIILLEKVTGKDLTTCTAPTKVIWYEKAIDLMASIPVQRQVQCVRRPPLFWILLAPVLAMKAIIFHPHMIPTIVRGLFSIMSNMRVLFTRRERSLIHRDLNEQNIFVDGIQGYLLDYQLASIADPALDYAVLFAKFYSDKKFIEALEQSPRFKALADNKGWITAVKIYAFILCMYDLSLVHGRHASSQALLRDWTRITDTPSSSSRSGTGKTKSTILTFVLIAIIAVFLGLSVRGNMGNPQGQDLENDIWKTAGPFELSPERGRFALTYSLIENNSVFFPVDIARFVLPDLGYKNGHFVSLFAPGVSYIIAPGYYIGKLLGAAQVGTFTVIALFALANFLLIKALVKEVTGSRSAGVISGFVFLFATPAYAYAVSLYQHHISTFLILASTYLVIKHKKIWSLIIIWFLCAASIPVDYPNLVLMMPIGVFALNNFWHIEEEKNTYKIDIKLTRLLTLLGAVIPLLFFLWFNNKSYGNPLQFSGTVSSVPAIDSEGNPTDNTTFAEKDAEATFNGEVSHKSALGFFEPRKMLNGIYIHIISPDRGIVIFTPVLLFGIGGLVYLARRRPDHAVLLGGIVMANILLYSMWGDPWGGWAFGSRYMIPAYAILSILTGVFLANVRKRAGILVIFLLVAGYSVYVNTAGALSTSANPPQVQILSLEAMSGRRERYSFDRNIEYLQSGSSKSFVYRTWLSDKVKAWDYMRLLAASITACIAISVIVLYSQGRKK